MSPVMVHETINDTPSVYTEQTTAVSTMNDTTHSLSPLSEQAIAERAYLIYEEEGSIHGNHEAHWYQAIQELTN